MLSFSILFGTLFAVVLAVVLFRQRFYTLAFSCFMMGSLFAFYMMSL